MNKKLAWQIYKVSSLVVFSLTYGSATAYQGPVDRSAADMHANQANSKSLQITLMMYVVCAVL